MTNIAEYIPMGYENRVSRSELRRRTGQSDRMIRRGIQYENENGDETIINLGDGYFIPDPDKDAALLKSYIDREFMRAMQIGKKLQAMQRKAEG